jgi:hypothetical protein
MSALEMCPECGVPRLITTEHIWLNNGDIVQSRNHSSRMIFIETENLDPLFQGIEQIIGTPIEHLVITAGRRAYRGYLRSYVPKEIREKIARNELDYEPIDAAFRDIGRLNGVGSYALVERRYERDEDDYDIVSISEPYSVPLTVSAHVGAIELLTGVDQSYTCEEKSPGLYFIRTFPSPHPEEMRERLWFKPHEHTDGDIELEACGECGGPRALSAYRWLPDRGIVVNTLTRRRMAIQGDVLLDPIFQELESELGDIVPRAVVEAQRRFTKSGFYTIDDITDEGDFRVQLALRGLGNLKELSMKRTGMHLRLENAALPLIVIGLAQGFFEMGFGIDATSVDWEILAGGTLEALVKPLGGKTVDELTEANH